VTPWVTALRSCTAAALILATSWGVAQASDAWTLLGEVNVTVGVARVETSTVQGMVPASLQARLALEGPLAGGVEAHVVARPTWTLADLSARDASSVAWQHGLAEAYLLGRATSWDVTVGLRRWPLGEMRLTPLLLRDESVTPGEPRGVWGARATGFLHPWRVEVGVTREAVRTGAPNDVTPGAWGAATSLRFDAPFATLSAHVHGVTGRDEVAGALALGTSVSATVADLATYGEAWWVVREANHTGRVHAGVGVSGYLADVLWTVEGAWRPRDVALASTGGVALPGAQDGRPIVRASASVPVSIRQSVDVTLGGAWPDAVIEAGRSFAHEGTARWSWMQEDYDVRVLGGWTHDTGATGMTLNVVWTGFF